MSRSFGEETPHRPHLTRSGRGKEIADVREDIDRAFNALESEIDGVVDLVTLSALPDEGLPDGKPLFVAGLPGHVRLDRSSSDPLGDGVYATHTGVGRWLRVGGLGGEIGPTGPAGPTGPIGPTGPQGESGSTGAAGADGGVGPEGPTGPAGPAGSANISGATNKLIKFTDTDVGGDSALTEDGATCTSTLPLIAQVDGIGTGTSVGMAARNTTVTSSGQVQNSPRWELGGRAFASGADTPFAIYMWLVPSTGGTYRWNFARSIGVTESTVGYFTSSTPGQFVGAFATQSGFASLTNGGFFFDADNSGMFRGGSGGLQLFNRATGDPFLLRSPVTPGSTAAFRIYANGGAWSATQTVIELGDDSTGSFLRFLGFRGDGSFEGHRLPISVTTGTLVNVTAADTGKAITLADAEAIVVNLPAGSVGLYFWFKNKGVGTATLTPNGAENLFTSTQVGTYDLVTGASVLVVWDGTDWCVFA